MLELGCWAYLGAGNYSRRSRYAGSSMALSPNARILGLKLMEGVVQSGAVQEVLGTVIKLKERLRNPQERNEFLNIIEKLYEMDESNLEVLEVLSGLYNELNREDGLRRSLSRLFNLYLASEKYQKAADTLERMLDVDPYGEGHYDRLLNLEGHIDSVWYKNIQVRTEPPSFCANTSPCDLGGDRGRRSRILGRPPG